jgi:hypothetical protein
LPEALDGHITTQAVEVACVKRAIFAAFPAVDTAVDTTVGVGVAIDVTVRIPSVAIGIAVSVGVGLTKTLPKTLHAFCRMGNARAAATRRLGTRAAFRRFGVRVVVQVDKLGRGGEHKPGALNFELQITCIAAIRRPTSRVKHLLFRQASLPLVPAINTSLSACIQATGPSVYLPRLLHLYWLTSVLLRRTGRLRRFHRF